MTTSTMTIELQHSLIKGSMMAVCAITKAKYPKMFSRCELEDIAGNTNLCAWRSFSSYDPSRGAFSSWLGKIAYHCVLDEVNDKMKRLPIQGDIESLTKKGKIVNVSDTYGFNSHDWDADRDINLNEFLDTWDKAVATMSEKDIAFYKGIEDELKPRELAAEFDCSPSAASMRKFHIQEHLKPYAASLAKEYDINCKKLAG